MGVFSKDNSPEGGIKRNPFDLSYQNNLTGRMGYLYPCMAKEVISGDTFKIDVDFGLRFMPTAFPLQTKMRAFIDAFYVRNRNLWHGWKNWFTGVGKPQSFPVLSREEMLLQSQTGSLGDYLGLPTTIVGPNTILQTSTWYFPVYVNAPSSYIYVHNYDSTPACRFNVTNYPQGSEFEGYGFYILHGENQTENSFSSITKDNLLNQPFIEENGDFYYKLPFVEPLPDEVISSISSGAVYFVYFSSFTDGLLSAIRNSSKFIVRSGCIYVSASTLAFNGSDDNGVYGFTIPGTNTSDSLKNNVIPFSWNILPSLEVVEPASNAYQVVEATDVLSSIPYQVSALPFRAYEQIYNAFYRDDRNNPYIVDGYADPNVFLPTYEGGVDNNHYGLHKANWEQDFLTTALPSPQYGYAPLVGITSSGVASFTDTDGNIVTSRLAVGDDGDTVVGFSTTNDPTVNRSLVSLAQSGISINDFRGVNSLQRYLEAKYRKGLKYRDQILSHFGVDVRYDELDMPEFIGSVSQSVAVTQINQNSASGEDPLGSYAGQLSCVGSSNSFQHYCDEPGFIICILRVVPVPVYSQLLPKHFLKTTDPLDYYSSEFAHLGFQPIKYNEVCPLQAENQDVSLDSTFGYQRAWYDYLASTDEIHGQFRTTLNNFILARVFNTVPSLNEEFLTVDPNSMNDVFTVNEVNGEPVDTFLGQIHFRVTAMRQIPRFGVPRLE